ncbi:MAG: hypothetical protein R3348_09995 [Xanthomonadales bacterium]|nr:hypothetical protein [Xanthomonadales bacterium]
MKAKLLYVAALLLCASHSLACEYKQGETLFKDWADCRYGEDAVVTVEFTASAAWDQCIYQVEAFRPAKLLAVTKMENGKEVVSINDRSKIGNPCYMVKSSCDKALKAAGY